MYKKIPRISDSEWKVMEIVWREGKTRSQIIIKELAERNDWADTTIKTLIKRLVDKKILAVEKDPESSRGYIYSPRFTKDEYAADKTQSLVNRFYNGAVSDMLAGFIKNSKLTEHDILELKELIDDYAPSKEDKE